MIKNAFTLLKQLQQSRNVRFLRKINLGILLWALHTDLTGALWCFISIWGTKQESWWIPFKTKIITANLILSSRKNFANFSLRRHAKLPFALAGTRISNDRTKLIHRFLPMNSLQDHWFMTIFTLRKKIHTSFKPKKKTESTVHLNVFRKQRKVQSAKKRHVTFWTRIKFPKCYLFFFVLTKRQTGEDEGNKK